MNKDMTSGKMIADARREKGYTQKYLAEMIGVSDKAVSKWECDGGCPDIRILASLADALDIDEKVLLSGMTVIKEDDNGNMKNVAFCVCPECGNIITCSSDADISCCGRKLSLLIPQKCDEIHDMKVEIVDDEYYLSVSGHPMTKEHYIKFMCFVTGDRMYMNRLYAEQNAEVRFQRRGHGYVYLYCNNHGMFKKMI